MSAASAWYWLALTGVAPGDAAARKKGSMVAMPGREPPRDPSLATAAKRATCAEYVVADHAETGWMIRLDGGRVGATPLAGCCVDVLDPGLQRYPMSYSRRCVYRVYAPDGPFEIEGHLQPDEWLVVRFFSDPFDGRFNQPAGPAAAQGR